MPAIYTGASSGGGSSYYPFLDEGIAYVATVIEMTLQTEVKGGARVPVINDDGKATFIIALTLDDEATEDGEPIALRRKCSESWGFKRNGDPSILVEFLAAATGRPPSDKSLRHLSTEEIVGKQVRVRIVHVERDGVQYTNIEKFLALPKRQAVKPAPVTQTVAPQTIAPAHQAAPVATMASRNVLTEDEMNNLDEEIPFSEAL